MRVCVKCGKEYDPKGQQGYTKTCSLECRLTRDEIEARSMRKKKRIKARYKTRPGRIASAALDIYDFDEFGHDFEGIKY